MIRAFKLCAGLALPLAALALAACHGRPEPQIPAIRVVETKVAVPVPCPALEALGDEPAYPDSDEAVSKATSLGELAALYAMGRLKRIQRLAEYTAAKGACVF